MGKRARGHADDDPPGDARGRGPATPPFGSTRRGFLAGAAGTALAAATQLGFPSATEAAPEEDGAERRSLPRRTFGKTGEKVTIFGLGCFPLASVANEEQAVAVVLRALDAGCNYLDTAPSYGKGASERRVATALAARDRSKVFLASKTHTRTYDDAWRDVETSLKRLRVERIDLLQIHAVSDMDDLKRAVDEKRGPLAALIKAREQKLIRFIGVTGHADPAVMRASFERWAFDSVLIPLNCVDPHYVLPAADGRPPQKLSFLEQTLPPAVKKGLARVAMKVFSSGKLPQGGLDARQCLRFTYGLDVATTVVGCRSVEEVDLAVRVARENKPLSAEERKSLLAAARPLQGQKTEWYKRG